jgi:hypothetical protein
MARITEVILAIKSAGQFELATKRGEKFWANSINPVARTRPRHVIRPELRTGCAWQVSSAWISTLLQSDHATSSNRSVCIDVPPQCSSTTPRCQLISVQYFPRHSRKPLTPAAPRPRPRRHDATPPRHATPRRQIMVLFPTCLAPSQHETSGVWPVIKKTNHVLHAEVIAAVERDKVES